MNELVGRFESMTVFGVSLTSLALASAVALVFYLAASMGLRYAVGRARQVAERTRNRIDDMVVDVLGATNRFFLVLAALLIGLGMLDLSERWNARVSQLWFIALALQLGVWLTRLSTISMRRYRARHGSADATQTNASTTLLSWALRTVLWAVVLLAVLSNLGVNITAFVASLGVGGIAVALAVQNILGDLFASLSIAVDKPFEAGDFIGVGSVVGTVQYIGLKTTRIRSLSGEEIIIGNTDLLKQVVQNYKRMRERRIVFKFRVTHRASADQAEAISGIVRRIVEARPQLRFDRAHLLGFGEGSLDYEVVYIVKDPSYNLYMDEQQEINLQLMRELADMGVSFAVPVQTLHVASMPKGQGPALLQAPVEALPSAGKRFA